MNQDFIAKKSAEASTSHADFEGTVAADNLGNTVGGLTGLASLLNARGWPVAMAWTYLGGGPSAYVSVTSYTLAEEYGEIQDEESFLRVLEESQGKPRVRRFSDDNMPIHEVLPLFKELQFVLQSSRGHVDQFVIVEENDAETA